MNLYLGALLFYSVFLMALGLFIIRYPREAQNNLAFAGGHRCAIIPASGGHVSTHLKGVAYATS
jgi:hypothetical protein